MSLKSSPVSYIEVKEIAEWLTSANFKAIHIDMLSKRTPGTGSWFLESTSFKGWVNGGPATLWGTGMRESYEQIHDLFLH